ncbi:RNA methyltransferase [Marinomonas mediterranea]|jgi:RNA methyltransferase, TrmH family, group 1|uniref:tRNA (cytidine/uridine-2'-O-)-methyltransferase TrmJ n=1 Tax=Marinomonas mediterranea (strain ATCC 700492 / JCM 21426 / NBRC 103028 / MMB-1) TaxID=717774 RepID=F2K481_MARM1|nr:RNA methyltransferase [Marinomonas mediterranea]ADZ92522.1 RNA methyltransferase, TrmH family, group 1 [Marinomonas mediterranea MMB-1]WCN10468.1 TrmJ/YjtD family RNA methyltransferase [Marinomonas mediterranea]WCN14516.1 TrmJ/YjtD family RNA methyltransferase [Marinomonas mediterranea]WCN18567.1 TrmJ/YjtD family RNA methyltransferase [Marinomonas mediterranea MMB-1]
MTENIRIVLVNTSHPGNIGGAARAMKNMGLSKLVLVSPKVFPSEEAVSRASGASDLLDSAVVVDTLEEAISDCQLVIGTSARERHIPWPLLDPRESAELTYKEGLETAFVFGREDRGLTNEELQRCHYHVHIPSVEAFSSLNLATAVQVIAYELRMKLLSLGDSPIVQSKWDVPAATSEQMDHMLEHLENVLGEIEFLDPKAPRQVMTRFRRLYQRAQMDQQEMGMLRGVLTAIEKQCR